MASAPASKNVEEEVKCPICFEYLTDPVTLDCGHNYCRTCITAYCEKWEEVGDLECPICRAKIQRGDFRSNWQLANIVEKVKLLPGKRNTCERHQRTFTLFCKDDEELICSGCKESLEHGQHTMLPLEEAAREYKNQVNNFLEVMKKRREEVHEIAANTGREKQEVLKQIQSERGKMGAGFRQLHRFLEEQEKLLLIQMQEVENEITWKKEEHMTKLQKEVSCLEALIREGEERCQQPASELLQDIRSTLQRFEDYGNSEPPKAFAPGLKWKIWDFCDINVFLKGVMKQLKDTLECGLQLQKANVILDPQTAHPSLIISEDRKCVRIFFEDEDLPNNPERFENLQYIVGWQEFSRGRHFWEVTVEDQKDWAVGIAKKSVNRKDDLSPCPEEGIWEVGKWGEKYHASFYPENLELPVTEEPKRIRVSLNCEGGQVTFLNAETAALLYTFSDAPLAGETLLPSFYLAKDAYLILSP